MTSARRTRSVTALALVTLGLLAGCRGVPTSSAPQKVTSVGLGQGQSNGFPPPEPGAGPRDIVEGFVTANGIGAARSASLAFLTKSEQNSWSDATATIVANARPGTYDPDTHSLTVTGRIVGTLDKTGAYQPNLNGTGQGGTPGNFKFGIAKVHGQYRISSVPSGLGLLITASQFDSIYQAHVLYFYDAANKYLVPDIRYSSLDTPGALADWLLLQLAAGPRSTLTTAVSTDTLPTRAQDLQAKVGTPTQIRVDGARALSAAARDRLAAQIATSLNVQGIDKMTITDGGSRVYIPQVGSTEFTASEFTAALGPQLPPHTLYYLDSSGRIKQAGGPKLHGDAGGVAFDSMALSRLQGTNVLTVAGVQGSNLYVADAERPWLPTPIPLHPAQFSRPAWAPGVDEVWIGAGPNLYRIVTDGHTNKLFKVALPPAAPTGRISAVRISPDGSRVALVFASGHTLGGRLYIGAIVRNGAVTVAGPPQGQISPQGVLITDVAWADSLKLYATGYLVSSKEAGVFETRVDGADWTDQGLSTLPGRANTITATTNAPAWVDSNGYVWEQNGTDWLSPTSQDQTAGTEPMYLG